MCWHPTGMVRNGFLQALFWCSCVVFLWMFFSAERIERTADAGLLQAGRGADVASIAYRFAAEWRHGMAGDWPLCMPGFFLVAMAAWLWCGAQPIRRLILEGTLILVLAGVAAAQLAGGEQHRIALDMALLTSLWPQSGLLQFTATGALLAGLTLVNWLAFVLACRIAVARKSFRPFLVPAGLAVLLAVSRPYTLNDAVRLWMQRAFQGEPIAALSLFLVPTVSLMLYWQHLSAQRARGQGVSEATASRTRSA